MPSMSKMHEKCKKCLRKDDCENKRMVACAYIDPVIPNTQMLQPSIQPTFDRTITINTEVKDRKAYEDRLEENLKKALSQTKA